MLLVHFLETSFMLNEAFLFAFFISIFSLLLLVVIALTTHAIVVVAAIIPILDINVIFLLILNFS